MVKNVKYKGFVYVEAALDHKKCEKGTHWDPISKKCIKTEDTASGVRKVDRYNEKFYQHHKKDIKPKTDNPGEWWDDLKQSQKQVLLERHHKDNHPESASLSFDAHDGLSDSSKQVVHDIHSKESKS